MFDIPLEDRTYGRVLAARAAERPDKVFLRFEGARYTFDDAERSTNQLANGLVRIGISKGDHVALLLENGVEIVWTYFALAKIGAVAVPLNTAAKGELLAYYLNQSDARAIVMDEALLDRYRAVESDCRSIGRAVVVTRDRAAAPELAVPASTFDDVSADSDAAVNADVTFCDPFCLLYTSGTTGPSKGVISPHCHGIDYALSRANHLGYRDDDVLYTCLPLFHGNALYGACVPALITGATVVVSPRFSASRFWGEIAETGATIFNSLGAMTNILWRQPPGEHDRRHRARLCTMVPMPEFSAEFEDRFGLRVTSVYALSDFGLATIFSSESPTEKRGSAGQARPEVEVAILDDNDCRVPARQPGEICLRSAVPWVGTLGYYNMPEATVAANRNQWFHTGDVGYLDEDGYLFFVDRQKDAIRRRGENISAWEVEQIVQRHPAIEDVAAYAVRSDMSEDEVAVSVVLRAGARLSPEDLIRHCQDNMAYFMVPRFIDVVPELPRTAAQKVQKFLLREQAEASLDALWDREKAGIDVVR